MRFAIALYAVMLLIALMTLVLMALGLLPSWLEELAPWFFMIVVFELPVAFLSSVIWRRVVVEGQTGGLVFSEEEEATARRPTLETLAVQVAEMASALEEISEKLDKEPDPEEKPKVQTSRRRATQKGKR